MLFNAIVVFLLLAGAFSIDVCYNFCVLVVFLSLVTEILAREGVKSLPSCSGDGSLYPTTYAAAVA